MADIANELSQLMEKEYVVEVLVVLAAYMVPTLLKNTIDSVVDLPDEAYGLVTAAGGVTLVGGEYGRYTALGGGIYTAEQAAERVGIKQTIQNAGAN